MRTTDAAATDGVDAHVDSAMAAEYGFTPKQASEMSLYL